MAKKTEESIHTTCQETLKLKIFTFSGPDSLCLATKHPTSGTKKSRINEKSNLAEKITDDFM
jgi:hypothetical protein